MKEKQKHPDLKHLFSQGKLLGYTRALCKTLEECLSNQDDTHLETLLSGVYENSELLDFFEHYSAFVGTADLYKQLLGIKRKLFAGGKITKEIKAGTTVLFESLESYLSQSSPASFENDELKYMVLPAAVRSEPGGRTWFHRSGRNSRILTGVTFSLAWLMIGHREKSKGNFLVNPYPPLSCSPIPPRKRD